MFSIARWRFAVYTIYKSSLMPLHTLESVQIFIIKDNVITYCSWIHPPDRILSCQPCITCFVKLSLIIFLLAHCSININLPLKVHLTNSRRLITDMLLCQINSTDLLKLPHFAIAQSLSASIHDPALGSLERVEGLGTKIKYC